MGGLGPDLRSSINDEIEDDSKENRKDLRRFIGNRYERGPKNGRFLRIKVTLDLINPLKKEQLLGSKIKIIESSSNMREYPSFALCVAELVIR